LDVTCTVHFWLIWCKKIKIGQGLQSGHKELTVMCVYGPQSVYFSAYLCFSCICFDAGFWRTHSEGCNCSQAV